MTREQTIANAGVQRYVSSEQVVFTCEATTRQVTLATTTTGCQRKRREDAVALGDTRN